jgi:hypothetical protein
MPETHDDAGAMISQALSGLGQFASPVFLVLAMRARSVKSQEMFARNTLDPE